MKRNGDPFVIAVVILHVASSQNNMSIQAIPADTYNIDWYTVDGGGAIFATGGSYELSGTIGQYDARTPSGGSYKVNGGFWGFLDSLSKLYLPLIMR